MSSPANPFYPIMVIEDLYSGTYSGGVWLAVACADTKVEGENAMHAEWVLAHGPGGDDLTCSVFWSKPPTWIVAGDSPDAAVAMIRSRESHDLSWTADYLRDEHPVALKWQAFVDRNGGLQEN